MGQSRCTGKILALLFVYTGILFSGCSGGTGGGTSISEFSVNLDAQLGNAPLSDNIKFSAQSNGISTDVCQALFRISLTLESVLVYEKGVLVDLECINGVPLGGQKFVLLSGEVIKTLVRENQSISLSLNGSLVGSTVVGEFISGFRGRFDFKPQQENSLTVITHTVLENLGVDPNYACNNPELFIDIAKILICGTPSVLCGTGDENECIVDDPEACEGSILFPCDQSTCSCRPIVCPILLDNPPEGSLERILKAFLGCPGVCGNGVVEPGEQCDYAIRIGPLDLGDLEPDPNNQCGRDDCFFDFSDQDCSCTGGDFCGDGDITGDEQCDPESGGGDCEIGKTCDDNCECVSADICGDGQISGNEECDVHSDLPNGGCELGSECFSDCTCAEKSCGDGTVDSGETCDPGDALSCPPNTRCSTKCDFCELTYREA